MSLKVFSCSDSGLLGLIDTFITKKLEDSTMKLSRRTGVFSAALISLSFSVPAQAVVIDSFFGMNFVAGASPGGPLFSFELDLLSITYTGGGGATFTTAMPVFPGDTEGPISRPRTGLPDFTGLAAAPTFTTRPVVDGQPTGDGETTRTIGATVPINWDTSSGFPMIGISSITTEVSATDGLWELTFPSDTPYKVGLIPPGATNELDSLLFAPFGDIYDGLAGVSGNPVGTAIVSVAPPGFESWIGTASGDFIFAAAAPVPLPAAVWLFGSGLIGLVGMARRRKQS
jgi:hypothetical protein